MEPLTDGILIALFLWATVAVIKKGPGGNQNCLATCTSDKATTNPCRTAELSRWRPGLLLIEVGACTDAFCISRN